MDRAIREADRIGNETQASIESCWREALLPVLDRHKKTLEKMQAYEEQGKTALARALFRTSGMRADLTAAMLTAGKEAADIVNRQRAGILEVMADDDGT